MNRLSATFMLLLSIFGCANAFAPITPTTKIGVPTSTPSSTIEFQNRPVALQRQRYSVGQIQTMSLFGLGAPELAIIVIAAAFLLGPQKLAELGKDAGKIAGELKEVPKEFQKGLEEGEAEAKKSITESSAAPPSESSESK